MLFLDNEFNSLGGVREQTACILMAAAKWIVIIRTQKAGISFSLSQHFIVALSSDFNFSFLVTLHFLFTMQQQKCIILTSLSLSQINHRSAAVSLRSRCNFRILFIKSCCHRSTLPLEGSLMHF